MIKSSWQHITNLTKVLNHQLQLYRIDLSSLIGKEGQDSKIEQLLCLLNEEERIRLSRYRFHKDQIRYGVGRIMLRQILSYQLDTDPNSLTFSISKYGKPRLEDNLDSELKFNISHSGNFLLIGIGMHHDLGVDTEVYLPTIDHLDLAKSVFSQSEQKALRALPEEDRMEGFYRCWSLKESVIKSVGLGLQIPLDQFTVNLEYNTDTNCLLSMEWNPSLMQTLVSNNFWVDQTHSGAYTCHKSIKEVLFFDLTHITLEHYLTQPIIH